MKKPEIRNAIEEQAKFPSSVDFMLLGSCNLKCNFCFGPKHEIPAMQTSQVLQIIDKLALHGVEKIVFTGGEPTLINDLPDILKAAKNKNLTTVLSTNGIKLESDKKLLDKIAPNLDWIALPLEGDIKEINSIMRVNSEKDTGAKLFETVLGLIPEIRNKYPRLKIKLGTVVTKLNLDHIVGISDILAAKNAAPDTWKLYQIAPSEYGKINYSSLKVDDGDFERIYNQARTHALRVGIKNITKLSNADIPEKHLFINPLGEVLTVDSSTNDYLVIGNVRNLNEVANRWGNYVKNDLLTSNFEQTYPLK